MPDAELIRLGDNFVNAIGWGEAIEDDHPLPVKARVVATVIDEDEAGSDRRAALALAKDLLEE